MKASFPCPSIPQMLPFPALQSPKCGELEGRKIRPSFPPIFLLSHSSVNKTRERTQSISWLAAGIARNSKDQDMDRVEERRGKGAGTPLLDNYRMGNVIGRGSFAKVKRAEHVQTGQKVAIKILDRSKMDRADMEKKLYT